MTHWHERPEAHCEPGAFARAVGEVVARIVPLVPGETRQRFALLGATGPREAAQDACRCLDAILSGAPDDEDAAFAIDRAIASLIGARARLVLDARKDGA